MRPSCAATGFGLLWRERLALDPGLQQQRAAALEPGQEREVDPRAQRGQGGSLLGALEQPHLQDTALERLDAQSATSGLPARARGRKALELRAAQPVAREQVRDQSADSGSLIALAGTIQRIAGSMRPSACRGGAAVQSEDDAARSLGWPPDLRSASCCGATGCRSRRRSELETAADPPMRVLGEDLVLYRDAGGYGLVGRHCPHRQFDLSFANGRAARHPLQLPRLALRRRGPLPRAAARAGRRIRNRRFKDRIRTRPTRSRPRPVCSGRTWVRRRRRCCRTGRASTARVTPS